jgi:hypothetical protein
MNRGYPKGTKRTEKAPAGGAQAQMKKNKLSSPFNRKGARHSSNLLTVLQHTKGILEKLEYNLDNTFRTVNEITSLVTTIKGHSSQISRLAKSFSALGLNKKALGGGSSISELAELAQHPVVRKLAKELLTSLNKA